MRSIVNLLAIGSSETSMDSYRNIRRHTPADISLDSHSCESLGSVTVTQQILHDIIHYLCFSDDIARISEINSVVENTSQQKHKFLNNIPSSSNKHLYALCLRSHNLEMLYCYKFKNILKFFLFAFKAEFLESLLPCALKYSRHSGFGIRIIFTVSNSHFNNLIFYIFYILTIIFVFRPEPLKTVQKYGNDTVTSSNIYYFNSSIISLL